MGLKAVKFVGLSLPVAAGGVLGYAWYDPDFRKQLEDSIPYAKELLENILPKENETQSVPVARYFFPIFFFFKKYFDVSISQMNCNEVCRRN